MGKHRNLESISFENIKGVVFDFDGTLVSLDVNWETLRNILRQVFSFSSAQTINDILIDVNRRLGKEGLQHAYSVIEVAELEQAQNAIVNNEVIQFLKKCKKQEKKIAILSNNMHNTIQFFLDKINLTPFVDEIVAKENVSRYKPHPEGLMVIQNSWNFNSDNMLYVGNDNNDKICAEALDMPFYLMSNSAKENS